MTSRHDGVSCDSCMKGNFRGRRYKCLVCYDYDLCATCYEGGASTTRHLADHPMQCILTRSDFELYYGGESVSIEQPQSLTCPYCTRMGFTETTLQEHITADHPDTNFEVICPVCAYLPGGEANLATDDIAGHLTLEHRSGPRDLITFLDESASNRHALRRITHPARGGSAQRPRRSNMHFSSSGGLSPSSRDGIDPIAELLSQLSGVRRAGGGGGSGSNSVQSSSAPSQLQQIQMQLQLERQQVRAARQQLERLPKRNQAIGSVTGSAGVSSSGNHSATMSSVVANNAASNNNAANSTNPSSSSTSNSQNSTFLLPRCIANTLSDLQLQSIERECANRSLFTRELVVATLVQPLPDLGQPPVLHTPVSSVSTTTSSPENPAPSGTTSSWTTSTSRKITSGQQQQSQDGKRDQQHQQTNLNKQQNNSIPIQSEHQISNPSSTNSSGATSAASSTVQQCQGPQANSGLSTTQNTAPVVQNLIPHVIPQPLVLQQPLPPPVRNTGTGTIREQMTAPPSNAYVRGGVGSVTGTSRRKPVRTVDGRNQSTEPPPPH